MTVSAKDTTSFNHQSTQLTLTMSRSSRSRSQELQVEPENSFARPILSPVIPSRSLLSTRRPSVSTQVDLSLPGPPRTYDNFSSSLSGLRKETAVEFSNEDKLEDSKLKRSLQIDMKGLVGEAVGNVR